MLLLERPEVTIVIPKLTKETFIEQYVRPNVNRHYLKEKAGVFDQPNTNCKPAYVRHMLSTVYPDFPKPIEWIVADQPQTRFLTFDKSNSAFFELWNKTDAIFWLISLQDLIIYINLETKQTLIADPEAYHTQRELVWQEWLDETPLAVNLMDLKETLYI